MDYTKFAYVQEAARLRDRIDGKDPTKIFFTSDTHFGHGNIINFCKRPYENVAKMDNALIENWNATVGPTDDVYHLGDFCFNGIQRWWELIGALNGRIHLILGNHDLKYIDKGILIYFSCFKINLNILWEFVVLRSKLKTCTIVSTYQRTKSLIYVIK